MGWGGELHWVVFRAFPGTVLRSDPWRCLGSEVRNLNPGQQDKRQGSPLTPVLSLWLSPSNFKVKFGLTAGKEDFHFLFSTFSICLKYTQKSEHLTSRSKHTFEVFINNDSTWSRRAKDTIYSACCSTPGLRYIYLGETEAVGSSATAHTT